VQFNDLNTQQYVESYVEQAAYNADKKFGKSLTPKEYLLWSIHPFQLHRIKHASVAESV
jgi:siderophore synthetase component